MFYMNCSLRQCSELSKRESFMSMWKINCQILFFKLWSSDLFTFKYLFMQYLRYFLEKMQEESLELNK